MAMFGYVIPEHSPLQTNVVQVAADRWLADVAVPVGSDLSEITVFLTSQPLPDGWGATVYIAREPGRFEMLGSLNNSRPSNVYRLPYVMEQLQESAVNPFASVEMTMGESPPALAAGPAAAFGAGAGAAPGGGTQATMQLGICLESLADIANREATGAGGQSSVKQKDSDLQLAGAVATDLFNFMNSFVQQDQIGRDVIVLPPDCMNRWMERFKAKHSKDRLFWKRQV